MHERDKELVKTKSKLATSIAHTEHLRFKYIWDIHNLKGMLYWWDHDENFEVHDVSFFDETDGLSE